MSCKLFLWGLGEDYNRHITLLKMWERMGEIEIVGITANILPPFEEIDSWRVIPCNKIAQEDFDYLFIMNTVHEREIICDAMRFGILRKKIIPGRVLDIPYFNWNDYQRIRLSNPSIITNNCFGGLLYKTLGMECTSPFKNLSLSAHGLLTIFSNLEDYLEAGFHFKEWKIDPHSHKKCPVLTLRDVDIFFNHDSSVDEAVEKWNRRKKKINYNNLLLVIYAEKVEEIEEFKQIKFDRKICFVPDSLQLKNNLNVIPLKTLPGQKEFWEVVNSSATINSNAYNFELLPLLIGHVKFRIHSH